MEWFIHLFHLLILLFVWHFDSLINVHLIEFHCNHASTLTLWPQRLFVIESYIEKHWWKILRENQWKWLCSKMNEYDFPIPWTKNQCLCIVSVLFFKILTTTHAVRSHETNVFGINKHLMNECKCTTQLQFHTFVIYHLNKNKNMLSNMKI